MRHLSRWFVVVLIGGAWLSSGCGSDGGGNNVVNPGGSGTPTDPTVITLSAAFSPIQTQLVGSNAATFLSVSTLGPAIADVLGTSARAPRVDVEGLNPALYGLTFVFNGDAYVASELTGAPPNGVRFLLYPIGGTGVPNTSSSNGHLDLADVPIEGGPAVVVAAIVAGGVTVSSITLTGHSDTNVEANGTFSNASGSMTWPFRGQWFVPDLSTERYDFTLDLTSEIVAQQIELVSLLDGEVQASTFVHPEGTFLFNLDVRLVATGAGSVTEGTALIGDHTGLRELVACVSGSLPGPAFAPAVTSSCTHEMWSKRAITTSDAAALTSAYAAYRTVFELFQTFIPLGVPSTPTLARR